MDYFKKILLITKAFLKVNHRKNLSFLRVKKLLLALIFIVSFYLIFVQADRYVSIAKIVINQSRMSEVSQANISGLQSSLIDSSIVSEHIKSIEMLQYLDNELDLRRVYSRRNKFSVKTLSFVKLFNFLHNLDFFSRLSPEAGIDELHNYYLSKTKVSVDSTTGILKIEVQSFNSEDSRKILAKIINSSELFINRISKEVAKQQLDFIRHEVAESEEKIIDIQRSMQKIQQKFNVADPAAEVSNITQIIGELEKQKNNKEVDLQSTLEVEGEASSSIKKLKRQLKALNNQIQELKARVISNDSQVSENENMLFQQKNLERNLEFASSAYRATLATQEKVRSESVQNLKKLVVLTGPTVEQSASYPKRFYNFALFLCIFGIVYYILRTIYASIMSHKAVS
jgi:capsular polysaccharide transport system permease protein